MFPVVSVAGAAQQNVSHQYMTSNSKDNFRDYRELVSKAVVTFQLIEDNLKLYIKYSFKLIRVHLNSQNIPFRFDGQEYENAPLERLITVFAKLTDNSILIDRLNKVKNERNYCAHAAFVEYLKKLDADDFEHKKEAERIEAIAKESWDCFTVLLSEVNGLNDRIMKGTG